MKNVNLIAAASLTLGLTGLACLLPAAVWGQPAAASGLENTRVVQQLAGVRSSRESQAADLAFWESIKDSTNPAEYEAYLQAFPEGIFAPLARARVRLYQQKPAEAEPAAPPQPAPAPAPAVAPAPAPEPEPEPAPVLVDRVEGDFIARTDMNVRDGPGTNFAPIGTISRGSAIEVQGKVRDVNWYQIRTREGRTGYVAAGLVMKAARQAATPSPAPAPAPAPQAAAPAQQAALPSPRGETFRDCEGCPEMVQVPAGSFQMGTNRGDATEQPIRSVTIARPFALGRFEVTVAEWMACVSAGGCSYEPKATANPERAAVRNLSWDDAQEYITWLSQKTGRSYRLPSEAEWEYAARAGTSSRFWWGDRPESDKVSCKDCGGPWSRKAPTPVGSRPANPFGLHDMNGGVAEWTADCWLKSYEGAPKDGRARQQDRCSQRVLRGGSWRNEAAYLRSASRFFYDASVRYLVNGFRVAADLN